MPLNAASLRHSRNSVVRSILHPTDLSEVSGSAFAHALRISVATKSKLHLLHVSPQEARGSDVPSRATCTCTVGVIRGGRYTLGDRIQAGN